MQVSYVKFQAESNGANPRAENLSSKKLLAKTFLQKTPKWVDQKKMLLYRVSQKKVWGS